MTNSNRQPFSEHLPGSYVSVWYGLTALLLLALGALRYAVPVWELPPEPRVLLAGLVSAHLVSGAAILFQRRNRRNTLSLGTALTTTAAVYSLALLLFFGLQLFGSRTVVIGAFAIGLIACAVPFLVRRAYFVYSLILVAIAASGCFTLSAIRTSSVPVTGPRETVLTSTLHTVRVVTYSDAIPRPAVIGGGIAAFRDRFLLATGDGSLYVLKRRQDRLDVTDVRGRVPINIEDFRSTVSDPKVEVGMFRVTDVLVQELGRTAIRIFASHHVWNVEEQCFVLRVSVVERDSDDLPNTDELAWNTLFDSEPCLPIKPQYRQFAGNASGGRMALLDDNSLLLSVGDHEFDGVNADINHPQDESSSYGKTILIDLTSKSSRIFTLGHRNAQGLIVSSDGTIWETEHGPRGGDELNRIVPGQNYGWPLVTYGTNYESRGWPLNEQQGRHSSFTRPSFAWVPSVGVSSIVEVRGGKFPRWEGDLLVGSLAGSTLFHVRAEGDEVRFVEPIPFGRRIRDLALGHDGSIVAWVDGGEVAFLEPLEEHGLEGETLFWNVCGGCHVVSTGLGHGIGPDLRRIATRGVATAEQYSYSPALSALGGHWTVGRLDSFLLDPDTFAPNTAMRNVSVKDPKARAAIVDYLRTLRE